MKGNSIYNCLPERDEKIYCQRIKCPCPHCHDNQYGRANLFARIHLIYGYLKTQLNQSCNHNNKVQDTKHTKSVSWAELTVLHYHYCLQIINTVFNTQTVFSVPTCSSPPLPYPPQPIQSLASELGSSCPDQLPGNQHRSTYQTPLLSTAR